MFIGGSCDDAQTAAAIADTFQRYGYLCDTHTAVALHVYNEYRARSGDSTPAVIASTANPYKFSASVLEALGGGRADWDEFQKLQGLYELTGCEIPAPLAELKGKAQRFTEVCERDDMRDVVYRMLQIG